MRCDNGTRLANPTSRTEQVSGLGLQNRGLACWGSRGGHKKLVLQGQHLIQSALPWTKQVLKLVPRLGNTTRTHNFGSWTDDQGFGVQMSKWLR